MNRTERLYAMVELLRRRSPSPTRAVELAERFEVSVRTVERDLLALQEAGVPIWAQPGPGGGYALEADHTLPPLNFTPEEAVSVAVALSASGSMPFGTAGRSALDKILNAMSTGSKHSAAELADRVRVLQREDHGVPAAVSAPIEEALANEVALELLYRDREGSESLRMVEPAGLFSTEHGWYLLAWCRTREAPRAFRLDRILRAQATEERVVLRPLDEYLPPRPFEAIPPSFS